MNLLTKWFVEKWNFLNEKTKKRIASLALAGAMGVGSIAGLTGCEGLDITEEIPGSVDYTYTDKNGNEITETLEPIKNEDGDWVIVYPDTQEIVIVKPNEKTEEPSIDPGEKTEEPSINPGEKTEEPSINPGEKTDEPTQQPTQEPVEEENEIDKALKSYNVVYEEKEYNAYEIREVLMEALENGLTYEALKNWEALNWMLQRQPETREVIMPLIHEAINIQKYIDEDRVLDYYHARTISSKTRNLPVSGMIAIGKRMGSFVGDENCGIYITISVPYEFALEDGEEYATSLILDIYNFNEIDKSKYNIQAYPYRNFSVFGDEIDQMMPLGVESIVDKLGVLEIMGYSNDLIVKK